MEWDAPVEDVAGIGPVSRDKLAERGIACAADLVWTLPVAWAPGVTSCMRFRVRSTVDLPQPDGPMKAVMQRGGTSRVTSLTAWKLP